MPGSGPSPVACERFHEPLIALAPLGLGDKCTVAIRQRGGDGRHKPGKRTNNANAS